MDVTERKFEEIIERDMINGNFRSGFSATPLVREENASYGNDPPAGYEKGHSDDYDKDLVLLPETVIRFVKVTQPREWEKLKTQHGDEVRERFLKRLSSEIAKRGTLDVLRNGIRDVGAKLQLIAFKPAHGLNPELQNLYKANIFTVVRQLEYIEPGGKSRFLDLTIFLNGLPIFTAELKNPLTGQNVQNAIHQYKNDRDPREPLLSHRRCLAHFAVDPDLVYMATHLQKEKTYFLPFNRGRNGGAGNPPLATDFSTSYLWKEIWAKDSVLNLIQHFISDVDELDDKGNPTGKRVVIFPRYHQLDSVRRLIADARKKGTGERYLIQHSAGSGKSNSIAWLAHQLISLHDSNDASVFHSVIIITDRRVLDSQLQRTVRQFEQTLGVVENIDKTSRQLKQALEEGKKIIVTTLQKFPVIAHQIGELEGARFALIIDEAHSSQTGESRKYVNQVLSTSDLEDAEKKDAQGEEDDLEELINKEMRKQGRLPNVSVFAFTATPKSKTLELFGTRRTDGGFEPFNLYSMRQAIEEGFILDVLQNYATCTDYWNLLKKIENDPRYDSVKAKLLLKHFVELHEHTIGKKAALMADHFDDHVAGAINGKAKAMIVTRSRLHAVRYKLGLDKYLNDQKLPHKVLVAFSGTVEDGGKSYTESNMNGFPESQTADTFEQPEYRFMVVAFKFQTGFDQPLLHTMYVDKKLSGVNAVQTLSRINRIYPPHKNDTMVLDFANSSDEIQKAFEPYYDKTWLKEATDPNLLYDLEKRIRDFGIYRKDEVQRFVETYFNPKANQGHLHPVLQPAIDRYIGAQENEQKDFRGLIRQFLGLYGFLIQIITFTDPELRKLHLFFRFLIKKLPVSRDELPGEVQQQVDLSSYRIDHPVTQNIGLKRGEGGLDSQRIKETYSPNGEDVEPLSKIIRELNDRFGTKLTGDDKVFIVQLEGKLTGDMALKDTFRANTEQNARLTFDGVVEDHIQEMMDSNFKFYREVTDKPDFKNAFFNWLFSRYKDTVKPNINK